VEAAGVAGLEAALAREPRVSLVVLTRLAVTYDLLPLDDVRAVVRLAHAAGARVYADDAGGARVGPAIFGQPRTLEVGVDVGATGMDKYGTVGPRLGLLGGDAALVARIRARAYEFGLEARPMLYPAAVRSLAGYTPERVRLLVETTRTVGGALRGVFGERVHLTPVTAQLRADDLLALAMERAGLTTPPCVPIEATAAVAMLLLEDYGVITVHFAGMPPGTSSLLVKFVPPETLERFGGAEALAKAVDSSVDRLAALLREPAALRALLVGEG
jgi:L-seryl-tRNA(Ser) seleniumtransferase